MQHGRADVRESAAMRRREGAWRDVGELRLLMKMASLMTADHFAGADTDDLIKLLVS